MKLGLQTQLGAQSQIYVTIQLVPKPWKVLIIIPTRRRGTCKGVPVATWCSEWICKMRGGLVRRISIIPAALTLPLLRGAAVGRAPTIFQNGWFCTRISFFFQSPIFPTASPTFSIASNVPVPILLIFCKPSSEEATFGFGHVFVWTHSFWKYLRDYIFDISKFPNLISIYLLRLYVWKDWTNNCCLWQPKLVAPNSMLVLRIMSNLKRKVN